MSLKFFYTTMSQASVLLPVFAGLVYYQRLSRHFRIFFFFFMLSIGFEVLANILVIKKHNNMPGLHLFTPVEFLAFSIVYYYHFQKNSFLRYFIGINMVILIAVSVAGAFINGIWHWNTLSQSYSSVFLMLYSLIYFLFMFSSDTNQYSLEHPMFWVNIGVLIYFGVNILYFTLDSYLLNHAIKLETFSMRFHMAINPVANCLYAQSFRCFRKKQIAFS